MRTMRATMKKAILIIFFLVLLPFSGVWGSTKLDIISPAYIGSRVMATDGVSLYGISSTNNVINKISASDYSVTAGHDFAAGAVSRIWGSSTENLIFISHCAADGVCTLYRSTDGGANVTAVLDLGYNATDGHFATVTALERGFLEYDATTFYIGEYNTNASRSAGSTNDTYTSQKTLYMRNVRVGNSAVASETNSVVLRLTRMGNIRRCIFESDVATHNNALISTSISLSVLNNNFIGYKDYGVLTDTTYAGTQPIVKNNIFYGGTTNPIKDAASITETGVDYNIYDRANSNVVDGGHSVTADPLFISSTDYRRRCQLRDGTDVCATLVTASDMSSNAVCTDSAYVGPGTVPLIGAYNLCVGGGGLFNSWFNFGF